jgi:UbiD family decarboxylase
MPEAEKDLAGIQERVDPRFGVVAYTHRSYDPKGSAFVFEQVAGYLGRKVAGGSYGVARRLLRALGCGRKIGAENY